ncbi:hypothetical protein M407DRAFT_192791 [Tulasnella calospora MUT 4182]|uniref:Fe2OG dioxygenase domain-containing protein n=1 Tax=Tulasnella calospora MUT 4182 TaxID=1051891 RepID=A0A0C3M0U8_9AGAM|nr:hypothetical protein M407DRAFT_192791 [Tulasnella calospora MUT 4182]
MSSRSEITEIPIIDWTLIENGQKDQFLSQLRHAFVVVGFAYLKNPPVDPALIDEMIKFGPRLFDLPQEEKDALSMVNSPHFMGYNRLGNEITRGKVDAREQFDFVTDATVPTWKKGDPVYLKFNGPAQWPNENSLPGFKATATEYLQQVGKLGFEFMSLLAESLHLPRDTFDKFYESPRESSQHWCKMVKYPVLDPSQGNQGVGPHYDSSFLTLLLQASAQPGLQVQSPSGQWIDAKPIPGTLVVNLGKGLETVTRGVARATCHRVLSPDPALGTRYSIPYFQKISQSIYLNKMVVFEEGVPLPADIEELVRSRSLTDLDAVNYSEYSYEISGIVQLIGRIKSHRNVGERHYPELTAEIFGTKA